MSRPGLPRIRHLRHRALDRTKRQPIITEFLDERVDTAPVAFPDRSDVWDALKIDPPVVVKQVTDA